MMIDNKHLKKLRFSIPVPVDKDASAATSPSTCFLGPSEDGGDLVALRGVALGPDGGRAHAHRALVGLDPAQVSRGGAGAVRHLCVSVVRLQSKIPPKNQQCVILCLHENVHVTLSI